MTNLDIDRRLALAIGYRPEDVRVIDGVHVQVNRHGYWNDFHYQAAGVIYPIAEKFKMMPRWSKAPGCWETYNEHGAPEIVHTDPRTCIALAVIEAAERGLLK